MCKIQFGPIFDIDFGLMIEINFVRRKHESQLSEQYYTAVQGFVG
jgi:hypothetical protein